MSIYVPEPGPDGVRRYGIEYYARQEAKDRCVAGAFDRLTWIWNQCSRKRGHGPNGEFCKQHARMMEGKK